MGADTFGIPRDITLALARAQGCTAFVETGTYHGWTARWAAEHFDTVHTIERAETLFAEHSGQLAGLDGVTPHLGDSRAVLPRVLAQLGDQRAVHWLDGHWSGGETAGAGDECPLLDELACLAGRPDDVILIDDARLFLKAPPAPHDPGQWPTILDICRVWSAQSGERFVQVVDDVIFAVPGTAALRDHLVGYARSRDAK